MDSSLPPASGEIIRGGQQEKIQAAETDREVRGSHGTGGHHRRFRYQGPVRGGAGGLIGIFCSATESNQKKKKKSHIARQNIAVTQTAAATVPVPGESLGPKFGLFSFILFISALG